MVVLIQPNGKYQYYIPGQVMNAEQQLVPGFVQRFTPATLEDINQKIIRRVDVKNTRLATIENCQINGESYPDEIQGLNALIVKDNELIAAYTQWRDDILLYQETHEI
jgi:hypothetical protein